MQKMIALRDGRVYTEKTFPTRKPTGRANAETFIGAGRKDR